MALVMWPLSKCPKSSDLGQLMAEPYFLHPGILIHQGHNKLDQDGDDEL